MPTRDNGIETSTETTKENLNIPKWLNADIFEDILRKNIKDYKSVKDFRAFPGTAAGDNYATIMLRIEIDVETKSGKFETKSYMIKLPYQSELYKETIKKTNIFDIERGMYVNVVTEMEELYRSVGADVKFSAQAYEVNVPSDYVLLEDLRPKGFKNANRFEGLDVQHTENVLRKMAQWHAASAVRVETKGKYEDVYCKGFVANENRDLWEQFRIGVNKTLFKHMPNCTGYENYVEDVRNIQEKLFDEIYKMAEVKDNEFNVLNHGDCWSNNIMFQYDKEGNIQETYFVDYQIPKYGTNIQDLVYFLISSTNLNIKTTKFEYFVRYYHDHLLKNLKLLQYSKNFPTLKELHATIYKYGCFGYFTTIMVTPAVLLEANEDANFDSFFTPDEKGIKFKNLLYSNPLYLKHFEVLLPWLQNRGALE